MHIQFKVISLSYKNAPLKIRELVSLDEQLCKNLMMGIKDFPGVMDILVLSTCNRTEIYYSSEQDYSKEILFLLGTQRNILCMDKFGEYFNLILDHDQSVQHLFEVSNGLDSQVLGDNQIGNQVKQAYLWSTQVSASGPFLHRLLDTIFSTHKKIARTTSFRSGAASASYATVELAKSICAGLAEPRILIIGLGEIGIDVCRHMIKTPFDNITIANRTFSKTDEFTRDSSMKAIPFDKLWEAIEEADIIISSVQTSEPIITKEKLEQLPLHSHKYFIDLAVPRSVEHTLEENPGVLIYNIDYIQNKTTQVLEKRIQAIPEVRRIIAESIIEINAWTKEMEVSPTIHQLKESLEKIRRQEISRYLKNRSNVESDTIELITKNIVQKIIKFPVLQLKEACKKGESEYMVNILHQLFDLKEQSLEITEINKR